MPHVNDSKTTAEIATARAGSTARPMSSTAVTAPRRMTRTIAKGSRSAHAASSIRKAGKSKAVLNLNKTDATTPRQTTPIDNPSSLVALPSELLTEIAEHLASAYTLGSLANLNVVCRRIYRVTSPILNRSLILVRRDPQGFQESERPVPLSSKGGDVPRSWQYTQYLHVGKNARDELLEYGKKKNKRLSDAAALQKLFPRLSVLFLRILDTEHEAESQGCAGRRSFYPNSYETNITQIKATIYRPIRPSALSTACVIGSNLRQTSVADTTTSMPENYDSEDECDLPEFEPERPTQAVVIDNLSEISFSASGTVLPGDADEENHFPDRVGDHPKLKVNLDSPLNGQPLSYRPRDLARGLLALLPPRTVRSGIYNKIPEIFLSGTRVPYKEIVDEILRQLPIRAKIYVNDQYLLSAADALQHIKTIASQLQARWREIDYPESALSQTLVHIGGVTWSTGDPPLPLTWSGTIEQARFKARTSDDGSDRLQRRYSSDDPCDFERVGIELDLSSRTQTAGLLFERETFFYQALPEMKVIRTESYTRGW